MRRDFSLFFFEIEIAVGNINLPVSRLEKKQKADYTLKSSTFTCKRSFPWVYFLKIRLCVAIIFVYCSRQIKFYQRNRYYFCYGEFQMTILIFVIISNFYSVFVLFQILYCYNLFYWFYFLLIESIEKWIVILYFILLIGFCN